MSRRGGSSMITALQISRGSLSSLEMHHDRESQEVQGWQTTRARREVKLRHHPKSWRRQHDSTTPTGAGSYGMITAMSSRGSTRSISVPSACVVVATPASSAHNSRGRASVPTSFNFLILIQS